MLPVGGYNDQSRRRLTRIGVETEHLHHHLTHVVSLRVTRRRKPNIEREGETQRDGDEQATNQNRRVGDGVAVQNVARLPVINPLFCYSVAAVRHVARKRVDAVQCEDEDIGEEDHERHARLGRILHVAQDGDELHLRAVPVAEHRHREEDVAAEDEGVQLRLHRVPHARLAVLHAGSQVLARRRHIVRVDHAGALLAGVVRRLRELAGLDLDGLTYHDDGDVENADDREEGRVAESGDLLLKSNREDDEQRDEDQHEFAAEQEVEVRRHFAVKELLQTEMELIGNDDGVAHASTKAV